ncbi:MAG TPA: hypothetical protein VKX16_01485 [Chloroflexota bacterium]|nr:hypothetical protein [Chloroflexota bacterium]
MGIALVALAWLAGLGMALYASEMLVHALTTLGARLRLSLGLLGILIAFGADAPEVTSALIAALRGSTDVGMGVILGSNIYNLAALLGLSAAIAGSITTNPYRLTLDGGMNGLLTLGLVGLILVPGRHLAIGVLLLLLLLAYMALESASQDRVLRRLPAMLRRRLSPVEAPSPPATSPASHLIAPLGLAAISVVFIIAGSDILVNTSLTLGARLGLPSPIIGTFVLAIATSLPNTWAAISLARRGLATSAVAMTFSSNSINAGLGTGLPSLVVSLHVSSTARTLGAPWLIGMTALAIVLLATRRSLSRREGMVLLAAYGAFVAVYLAVLH